MPNPKATTFIIQRCSCLSLPVTAYLHLPANSLRTDSSCHNFGNARCAVHDTRVRLARCMDGGVRLAGRNTRVMLRCTTVAGQRGY